MNEANPARLSQYVVGIVFDKRSLRYGRYESIKVLLQRKTSPPRLAGQEDGIGGEIQPDELPLAAMRRTMLKETGIDVSENAWHPVVNLVGHDWQIMFFRTEIDFDEHNQTLFRVNRADWFDGVLMGTLAYHDLVNGLQWVIPLAADLSVRGHVPVVSCDR